VFSVSYRLSLYNVGSFSVEKFEHKFFRRAFALILWNLTVRPVFTGARRGFLSQIKPLHTFIPCLFKPLSPGG
jgi:hypothetical protein